MSDFDRFDDMFGKANEGGAFRGKYSAKLSLADNQLLDDFVQWLKAQGMSDASRNSYRSYMAKAIAAPELKLTSDQKSAIRKFRIYLQGRK